MVYKVFTVSTHIASVFFIQFNRLADDLGFEIENTDMLGKFKLR